MYRNIVVLTGAGISAESGIRTFRDQHGLWEQHHIEDVATPEGYAKDIELVERFYNNRWQQLHSDEVSENLAHIALAKLEAEFDGNLLVITQNVDDLHERAGSRRLLHMHGELSKGRCPKSLQTFILREPFGPDNCCTCCIPAMRLRPHIVWFGEMPFGMDRIHDALDHCDLFIAIGTSGTVYPAAGFVDSANHHGAQTVEVNLVAPDRHSQFQYHFTGKAGDIVPQLVEDILKGKTLGSEPIAS
ncbi:MULTISPECIES: Sir2 family NAD+-dependent deacetylase [Shewanella]|uniref:NAD-dependent protein deacylase n=1 Tax=Shewanella holmiensis TaxID=2952222 RepID=A0A9X3AUR0_9GAMM|nr:MULTISPECIES: Sir2 family NAD+-dependent deacetylase [Shewanella]MCT7941494.1 NAD-dependent protein deacylase [Shewanella holmiensis]MDP5145430.1 NAD-dependent protein deacylase [Shewanella sp. ULN5]